MEGGDLIESSGARRRIPQKLIVAALIGLLALIFVFQNAESGRVDFLFWSFEAPAWLWLLIIFLAGALVGWIFGRRGRRRD
jgi:uncharacterized integral membrane protein